jgi:AraC-like DNA-binding protein
LPRRPVVSTPLEVFKKLWNLRQVRTAALTGYIDVSHALGVDPFELLRRAGIHPSLLDDPESRLAAELVVELLEESARQSGCDSFGTRLAASRSFANLGPLSLLLERLATVDDVVGALVQYRRLMNDIVLLECERESEISVLRWVIDPEFASPQIVDLVLALGYRILTEVSGRLWCPETVHFAHSMPADVGTLQKFYDATLEFECEFNGYSCLTSSLSLPASRADPIMARNASRLLDLVAVPTEAEPLTNAVRRAISLLLPIGRAGLNSVAATLAMKPRTLQRRLDEESSAFAALLNETRRDLVKNYLADSTHPMGVVAELIGYASQSSFSAWFVAEFQTSPRAWRQANSKPAAADSSTKIDLFMGSNDNEFVKCFSGSPADF